MRHGKYPFVIGFLIVPVTLYVVFVVSPYLQAFYISLTNWRGYAPPKYVGLDNYHRLFADDTFWKAVRHNGLMLLTLPLITIAIALFFAFLLNIGGRSRGGSRQGVWGSKFYRVVFFFPQLLAVPIIAVLFQTVYRPNSSGLIDGVLIKLGIEPVGFYLVLFSAGMGSVPAEIYEAAELDGAGRMAMFFRVTLPLLRETLQVAWVYLGIAAFDGFAIVNVLSVDNGGPDGATTVLPLEIWRNAFIYSKFGYASSMGVALFFLTLTFAALILRVTRREAIEY